MITKITSDNDLEFYAPRFQQITEALAIENEHTRSDVAQAIIAKIGTYTISNNAKTYLSEVILNKKVRAVNKQALIDAFASALVEHSSASLSALYREELSNGTMSQAEIDNLAIADSDIEIISEKLEELADIAVNKAREVGLVVDSLETYFSNLDEIKRLQTSQLKDGKFLLVMPADEPYFEIDANARTINVPADFKKYGVGVYGDHYAELLTFKIDRYFDNQDFMNTKIAINWNFTPTGSRVPAFESTQAQEAFAKDDELEPGYVVFGFFVTKEMTPSKGTLSFSVTCYNEANNEITYSFNTQVAQVNINDGFTLLNPSEVKNAGDDFLNRISSSAYTPEGVSPIEDPVWELGALDENNKPLGLENELNFNIDENGVEDEVLEITTQAYAPGINTMKYTWFVTPVEGNAEPEVAREPDTVTKPSDFFKTRDISVQENSVYYKKNEDNTINPTPLTAEEAAAAFANNEELYELGSTYEAVGAGRYYVQAQASKTTVRSNGTYIKTVSNRIESNSCLVPAAVKPAVTIEVESALTPENTDFTIINDETEYKFIDANHAPVINAVVISTDENIPLGAIALEALRDEDIAELSAEDIIENTKSEENLEGKYEFGLMPATGMIQVNAAGVTAEGEYRIRAINRRNHTYSVSVPSEIVKTSFVAPKITDINLYTMEGSTRINLLANGDVPVDAILDDSAPEDGATVEFNPRHLTRTFVIDDNSEGLESYYENGMDVKYFVEELAKNGTGSEAEYTLQPNDNPGAEGPDVIEVIEDSEYEDAYHLGENKGAMIFTISNDQGYYRIRTESRYHGTLRIAYSHVFKLTTTV